MIAPWTASAISLWTMLHDAMLAQVDGVPLDQAAIREATLLPPLAVGLLLTCLGAVLLALLAARTRSSDHAALGPPLRRFCGSLGISHTERRLLVRLASRYAGATGKPTGAIVASMLLTLGAFDDVARGGSTCSARERKVLDAVRDRLFDVEPIH